MREGRVLAIHIAAERGAPLHAIEAAQLVPGKGIRGDRQFAQAEAGKARDGEDVTFIEAEALEAVERDYGLRISGADSRRNVLTQGVALNHLVGRRFRVGEVECEGVELCEPCGHLQKLTQNGVLKGLIHRGGLRARILNEGTVRPGDAFEEA